MANVEHSAIVDPEIHEPKGVASASVGNVYVANGTGSGSWGPPSGIPTVVITVESDFPAPSGGVITLAGKTDYLVVADITTANRFVMQEDTLLRAEDSSQVTLIYTGSGDFFTGVDVNSKITKITLSCPSARLFNMSSSDGSHNFQFVNCTVITVNEIAVFDGLFAATVVDTAFLSILSTGITFLNNISFFLMNDSFMTISSGAIFDLGTATFDTFETSSSLLILNGSSNFISGLTTSANINSGGLGTVLNIGTKGTGVPLSGVTTDDARWQFSLNDDIADTRPDSLISNVSGTTVTISTVNTPVKIGGTWTDERASVFTNDTGGKSIYIGGKDAPLPIDITLSIEPVSGTNKAFTAYVAIDGTVQTNSGISGLADSGSPQNLTLIWQTVFQSNTFVEVFIENNTDTVNLQLNNGIMRVN